MQMDVANFLLTKEESSEETPTKKVKSLNVWYSDGHASLYLLNSVIKYSIIDFLVFSPPPRSIRKPGQWILMVLM